MPTYNNISLSPNADATIQMQINPLTSVGAWEIDFRVHNRYYGISGLIHLSTASGYANYQSGMAIVNSGNGIIAARISGGSLSGWQQGTYAYQFNRVGSGVATLLADGYLMISY